MSDKSHSYQIEGDTVFYCATAADRREVCKTDALFAVGWDTEGNVLHKHGEARLVGAHIDQVRKVLAELGVARLAETLRVTVFPITHETIEEVNACIEITGRVGKLEERLSSMAPVPGSKLN